MIENVPNITRPQKRVNSWNQIDSMTRIYNNYDMDMDMDITIKTMEIVIGITKICQTVRLSR